MVRKAYGQLYLRHGPTPRGEGRAPLVIKENREITTPCGNDRAGYLEKIKKEGTIKYDPRGEHI